MTVMSNKLFTDDFFDPSYAFLSDKIIKMHAKRHMQSLENFVENSCNSWIILHGWRNWDRIKSSFCT